MFITGRAGTGKSTLLQHFRSTTKKNVVVLAPTGVAALNVGGETIHSFFKFKPDITLDRVRKLTPRRRELYKKLDTLIIDEVSMVRADLLDCVARFLELNGRRMGKPFGGAQVVLFGDLYQLPPVVRKEEGTVFTDHYPTPYFFSARSFRDLDPAWIELEKVFRQEDEAFLEILNAIRGDAVSKEQLAELNRRVHPNIEIDAFQNHVFLTTTNARAAEINQARLDRLPSKPHAFQAEVRGDFEPKAYPTAQDLVLKEGAQVMLLNNDSVDRWVNGTVARVRRIRPKDGAIDVSLQDGREEEVASHRWDMFRFGLDETGNTVNAQSVGQFIQLPVKLAWAITIHKSQGLTFERAVVDLTRSPFAHGQLYVALSRLKSMEGLVLTSPVEKRHILLDGRVQDFLSRRPPA